MELAWKTSLGACHHPSAIAGRTQLSSFPSLSARSFHNPKSFPLTTITHVSNFQTKTSRYCHQFSPQASLGIPSETAKEVKVAKDNLLAAISTAERGLKTKSAESRAAIFSAVEALEKLGEGTSTTTAAMLSATWRLRWTTEKEILFILEKAGIFGTQAGEVFQVIDVARGKLNNIITFPPSGAFVVDSTIEVASPQCVNFKFEKAKLKTASWQIGLPPFGQGWFENVYVDETLRVARDSRGDVLIVERASTAWK